MKTWYRVEAGATFVVGRSLLSKLSIRARGPRICYSLRNGSLDPSMRENELFHSDSPSRYACQCAVCQRLQPGAVCIEIQPGLAAESQLLPSQFNWTRTSSG